MGDENCTNIIENANDEICKDHCQNSGFDLSNISPNQLATLANIIAILLSNGRKTSEIKILADVLLGVGSLMLLIVEQEEALEMKEEKLKEISDLKRKIKEIEDSLKNKK